MKVTEKGLDLMLSQSLVAAAGQPLSCDCEKSGPGLVRIIEIPQSSRAGVRHEAADIRNWFFYVFKSLMFG